VRTIRHRLLISMLFTGLVPVLVILVPLLTVLNKDIRRSEEQKIAETARQLGQHVAEVMDRSALDLETLTTSPLFTKKDGNLDEKLDEMRRLVGIHETFADLSLYDSGGFLLVSTAEDLPVYREYSEWFSQALTGKVVVSQPQRRLGRSGLFLTVYLPVENRDSEVEQVIKARLSFERVMALLKGKRIGEGGSVVLLDAWGNVLCGSEDGELLTKFDPSRSPTAWLVSSMGGYTSPDGVEHLFAAEILPKTLTHVGSHWVLLAMKPMSEVKSLSNQVEMALVVATAGMIGVAIGLGWLLSRRMSLPLEKLGNTARLVAAGDLNVRADPAGVNEIDHLALSFNRMIEELAEHRNGLERLVLSRTDSLRRSQNELESASARLQAAFSSTNNGFLVEDAEGRVALLNNLFLPLLALPPDETKPESAAELIQTLDGRWNIPGGFAELKRGVEDGEILDMEISQDGDATGGRILHLYSAPILDHREKRVGRVWTIQDLTEQRNLEASLRQSQKMEAIGQLAGGVAHDFNNLLTAILGHLALVELEFDESKDKTCVEHLRHAVRAGERAADLVKQLLGFSRRSRMDLKPCDANEVLVEVRDILAATIDPRIRLELDLEPSTWKVMADLSLLSQVIMNMAVNSKDAMPAGGNLWLRSTNRTILGGELREGGDRRAGEFLMLTIQDNGEGIPYDVQKRIFEPFFTTKAPGKGTGLGLATCFGIVKQLGGWIELDSHPGKGTCFSIFLPRSAAAEAQPENPVAPVLTSGSTEAMPSSGGTVLVVDDEDIVRRVAVTLLTKCGYKIIEARDGLEALEILGSQADLIDLVMLDLTMPNLTGRETFRLIRERHGLLPVLICSGYLVDVTEFAEECGSCPDGFVQKPYRIEDLSSAIKAAIAVRRLAA
jgi:two-component system cell cycle sensor histidine kinase/response regulator CckA